MLVDQDHAVLEVLILVVLVILVVLSRVAVLPGLILFNTYVLHVLKKSTWLCVFCVFFGYLWFTLLANCA
jgi:hypothetical protein